MLTWEESVCTKLMLWLSLFYESLSMKMNNMNVFWPTHIQQVPSDCFTFIHPQALQIVGNPIDGWKKKIVSQENCPQNWYQSARK